MEEEYIERWITWRGRHIPVGRDGKLITKKKVNNYNIQDTTGMGYNVAMGKLEDNTYFGLSEDNLNIYNEDFEKAIKSGKAENPEWQKKHLIGSYSPDHLNYENVSEQIKEFKKGPINNKELVDRINKKSNDYSPKGYQIQVSTDYATGVELPVSRVDYGTGSFYELEEYLNELKNDKVINARERRYLMKKYYSLEDERASKKHN